MISGDIIWCVTCGAYADLRVGGLQQACEGKHTGPWKGGGKRGQLNDLKNNRHPRNGCKLPPPIAESSMTLDTAATTNERDLTAARHPMTRYNAKDKRTAMTNASSPAAVTVEKRQWIDNKRQEAVERAAVCRARVVTASTGGSSVVEMTSTEKKASIYARIRSGFKRPPPDSDEQRPRRPRVQAPGGGGLSETADAGAINVPILDPITRVHGTQGRRSSATASGLMGVLMLSKAVLAIA